MNVYISGDIEGVTGLVTWSQCGRPTSEHYDYAFARRMYTHDINAAIRGARAAGAERVVVKDSHGNSKNLLIDELEPGVELVSGHGSRIEGMMVGIDSSFQAAMLIGYHAMAGTLHGVMEHTISGRVHRMYVNGCLVGEMGLSAITAAQFGVPLVAVSSDVAGCAEAAALCPGISTAEVKQGFGRYMAQTKHPSVTSKLIEEAARRGVSEYASIAPVAFLPPYTVQLEFNRTEEADMAARAPSVNRVDAYTLECHSDSWETLHRTIWTMISLAEAGGQANS